MITNHLTFDDIYKQLSYDIKVFESSKEFKLIINKYRKEVIRTKKKSLNFRPKTFKSGKFQNNWFMRSTAVINNKTKNFSLDVSYYTFRYLERGGMIAYNLCMNGSDDKPKLFIFPQHFWERYRERFVKEDDLRGFDLIHYFFEYNGVSKIYNNKERSELDVTGICSDGLCLGEICSENDNIINFKTYISSEEMYNKQKDKFERGLKLAELENEFVKRFNLPVTELERLYKLKQNLV